jgi:hypothetical protein
MVNALESFDSGGFAALRARRDSLAIRLGQGGAIFSTWASAAGYQSMKKGGYRGLESPPLVLGAPSKPLAEPDAPPVSDGCEAEAVFEAVEPSMAASPGVEPEAVETLGPPEPRADRESAPSETIELAPSDKAPEPDRASPSKKTRRRRARRTPAQPRAVMPVWARFAYPVAVILAVVWSGAMIAFSQGYEFHDGPFQYPAFPPTVIGLLAVLPASFILLSAYAMRQAARLSAETARARELADELAIPAALAVDQASNAADAVRREIAKVSETGEAAERRLTALRETLADQNERLVAATGDAERTARELTESLARERSQLEALTLSLDARVASINDAVLRQTRLVTESSDLAAAQLQEAEATLAARTTGLTTAAGAAGEAAELAGEALTRQAERLEAAGDLVGGRLQGLSENLGRGHSRLAELAAQLQADQAALVERIEAQRSIVAGAADGSRELVNAATGAAEGAAAVLQGLIAEAEQRLNAVAASMQGEQAAIDARARAALSLFRDAVSEERKTIEAEANAALASLTQTAHAARDAAAASAEAARSQVEQLGEAAFAAGQRADQSFEARLSAARRAIEQSAALLDDASQRSVGRIDSGLATAREALAALEQMLVSVDQKIAAAPLLAQGHARSIKASVEASLTEIATAAHRIAAETEAVDAALQERVRRNYEMLSEALKTVGKVAAVTEQAAARAAASAPQESPREPRQGSMAGTAPVAPRATPVSAASAIRYSPAPATASPQDGIRPAALSSGEAGLRPRLRLTAEPDPAPPVRTPPVVHETLDAFRRPGKAAAPPAEVENNDWTWRDLLSSIDEPPIDDEVLAERLISEIEAMGLDASTLLPLSRIDEIAVAMQRGDHAKAREAVRGLAPGAVRRLSRRVLTDKVLRAQADRYVRRYEDLLTDSAKRDRDGFMTAALLGSEPGRAFLLFDAAVGELH